MTFLLLDKLKLEHLFYLLFATISIISVEVLALKHSPRFKERIEIDPYNVLYPNTTLPQGSEFEFAHGTCLNNLNCFLPFGLCINATTCMCMPDYAHIFIDGHSIEYLYCSYKKKKAIIAGLLEMFLPFGLGHMYSGHYIRGIIKFIYNLIIFTFCCVLFCKGYANPNIKNMLILCTVVTCIIPLWNIIDLFLFFSGYYTDGYGVSMA